MITALFWVPFACADEPAGQGRVNKHAPSFALSVSASPAVTRLDASADAVAVGVALRNNGPVPVIFENCECSASAHWGSDHPSVKVKDEGSCAQDECSEIQILPGQEIVRQIAFRVVTEPLADAHKKIDFRVGFRLLDKPESIPCWSNVISIEWEDR